MRNINKAMRGGLNQSLVIILMLLFASPAAAEKTGADLRISRKDGVSVEGELIAIKKTILVLKGAPVGKDAVTAGDLSIDLEEINAIVIKKRSNGWLNGAIMFGGLFGGYAIGYAIGTTFPKPTLAPLAGKLIGGVLGLIAGIGTNLVLNSNEEFDLSRMTAKMKADLLDKLRSKSRFPEKGM